MALRLDSRDDHQSESDPPGEVDLTELRGVFVFNHGGTDMGDKGSKDKGKREQQKKAKRTPKEKRKEKREKKNK